MKAVTWKYKCAWVIQVFSTCKPRGDNGNVHALCFLNPTAVIEMC